MMLPTLPAVLRQPLASLGSAAWTAVAGTVAAYGASKLLNSLVLGNPLVSAGRSWDWTKEIVLITGGSSGIGRAMVDAFVQYNVRVVVLDQHLPDAKRPFPEGVTFYAVDLTAEEHVHTVAEWVRHDVGDPTVLINNAGITNGGKSLFELTADEVRRVFGVNAIAPMTMVREFVPAMAARDHGHVVTMASMASFVVIAGNVDYSCTKASVMALHEGLTQDLRHRYNARSVRTTYVLSTPLLGGLTETRDFNDHVLKPETVALAVVKQVLSGCSGQIVLPRAISWVSMIRSFPFWLQERMRDSKADTLRALAT
ncbi:short chain dehydrogenase reductase [Grosmannia clavigera kw1407]|uniref:Short-chain dehydrogenase/reductase 3 n=1 Tax=Grosmannia clavigera (strain kw1407 / UAMH 11150) TaxID=655863 RepID=F0XKA7_GROCL|nr:short chain dehydrogenase reductase [Grosmannia clavigera kw1407]EFX02010.1 short chain dehydrogenase reductase [Grosmannia clavigera kw1407]